MSWARIDDHANEHRKQLRAGPEACWLWTCGLMYCNRQSARDGMVPEEVLGLLYPSDSFKTKPSKLAAKLVDVGLWERVPGGYRVHNWDRWNKSSEAIEAERAKGRERAKRSFERRRGEVEPESSPEESAKTRTIFGDSSPEDTPKHSEVFTVSSGSTPLHSKKIRSGREDPRPDTSGARFGPAPSALPASSESEPEARVPCPADLALTSDEVAQLEMAAVPADLVPIATAELRAKWVNDNKRRTLAEWRNYLRKSVTTELSDPKRRREYRARLREEPAEPAESGPSIVDADEVWRRQEAL